MSGVVTETGGVIVTGIGSTDSIAVRDGNVVTTGAPRTKSPREASAESHRIAVVGLERAGPQLSLCVVWPA